MSDSSDEVSSTGIVDVVVDVGVSVGSGDVVSVESADADGASTGSVVSDACVGPEFVGAAVVAVGDDDSEVVVSTAAVEALPEETGMPSCASSF